MARARRRAARAAAPTATRITVDQFAEVTMSALIRALERRPGPKVLGPIIYGFIYFPQGMPGEIVGPRGGIEGVNR